MMKIASLRKKKVETLLICERMLYEYVICEKNKSGKVLFRFVFYFHFHVEACVELLYCNK